MTFKVETLFYLIEPNKITNLIIEKQKRTVKLNTI